MEPRNPVFLRIIPQRYQRGDKTFFDYFVELIANGEKRLSLITKDDKEWLEQNTGTYIFGGNDRFYPKNAFTKLGVPTGGKMQAFEEILLKLRTGRKQEAIKDYAELKNITEDESREAIENLLKNSKKPPMTDAARVEKRRKNA